MLYRKKETEIKKWIKNPKNALLVTGARQVGKTFIIRECLEALKCDYIELNFIENPELVTVFEQSNSAHDLSVNLSLATGRALIPGKTYIFIDEIQQYKNIVTKIKFLVDEGQYFYCLSGSLLGVELVNLSSAPVGYIDEIMMYSLDFEEFLYANSVDPSVIDELKKCYTNRTTISEYMHLKMMELYRRYLAIGGMPAAVNEYVASGDMNKVMVIQQNIIAQYKRDFTKYEQADKRLMIRSIYDNIPSQLLKQNRRFNYTDVEKKLRFEKVESSFLWLTNAGVAIPVYNTSEPRVSLRQSRKSNLVKLYLSDIGLLSCLYGAGAKLKLLLNDKSLNCGGIYENAVAQELLAHGYEAYYYNSRSLGELDFVIEHNGSILPIEVKSGKDYYLHSAINNVIKNKEFQIEEAFILADCNIETSGKVTYMPIYLMMFLTETKELPVLTPIDFQK
ncbi:MAG: AAA family ATPase [Clostridia bacterium]